MDSTHADTPTPGWPTAGPPPGLPHHRAQVRALLTRILGTREDSSTSGLDALVRSASCESRSARRKLFARSSDHETTYLVVDGVVRLEFCRGKKSSTRILDLVGPGAFVSVSPLTSSCRTGLVHRTHGPVVLARLEPSALRHELQRAPADSLLTAMAGMRNHYLRLLSEQAHASTLTIEDRLLEAIRMMARRFGSRHPQGVWIDIPMTHDDWAALIGATRVNVTKAMGRLRRAGRIRSETLHLILCTEET